MTIESLKRYRTFLIVLIYLIIALFGIRIAFPIDLGVRKYLYAFTIGITAAYICIVDSKITRKPLPMSTYWLILIFYPVSIPVCLTRTHGIKGFGIFVLHYLGIMLTQFIAFSITNYFVNGSFFPY